MITNSVFYTGSNHSIIQGKKKKHNKDSIHDGEKMLSKCLNESAWETGLGKETRCSD